MDDSPTRVELAYKMSLVVEALWEGSPRMRHIARSLSRSHERILATDALRTHGNGGNPFTDHAVSKAIEASVTLCDKIETMVDTATCATDEEITLLRRRIKSARWCAKELTVYARLT